MERKKRKESHKKKKQGAGFSRVERDSRTIKETVMSNTLEVWRLSLSGLSDGVVKNQDRPDAIFAFFYMVLKFKY